MQELLTSGDVAARFGVSRQSVNNWVQWGWLKPALELQTGKLFTRAEVEKYAKKRTEAAS